MRLAALVLFLSACSTSEAGSDCPAVPQPGQTCKKEGAACIYAPSGPCRQSPEIKCTNGRFVLVMLPGCDASTSDATTTTDAPADAPKDSPVDSPNDAPSDG